ncbi:hypothetical protein [Dechloromonas sp. H13]|uniref:hypothetical protein n=1 Tax=Dechloromonas sp. H13 TaxID=2570193 RepID=UPI0012921386|nr:hypothetical protein [Dechloromonas sp. H13]
MSPKAKVPVRDKSVYTTNCHEKLNVQQISAEVAKMARSFGMAGSSVSFDLYKMNIAYLLHPEKRAEINKIIGVYGEVNFRPKRRKKREAEDDLHV